MLVSGTRKLAELRNRNRSPRLSLEPIFLSRKRAIGARSGQGDRIL